MIPIAKPVPADIAPAAQRKTVFRIFQEKRGRWCARSDDGMTGGTFFTHQAALRFVRREVAGMTALVLHIAPQPRG
ncbi:MAG TPA: hypothetical protein VEI03_05090 [Stellaceae bacterium]|nr:hypothetical protein [Stellaceae bacterium]